MEYLKDESYAVKEVLETSNFFRQVERQRNKRERDKRPIILIKSTEKSCP